MNTDDVVYTRSCRMALIKIPENKPMKIVKTGVLLLSMTVLMTSLFVTQEAFAGEELVRAVELNFGTVWFLLVVHQKKNNVEITSKYVSPLFSTIPVRLVEA